MTVNTHCDPEGRIASTRGGAQRLFSRVTAMRQDRGRLPGPNCAEGPPPHCRNSYAKFLGVCLPHQARATTYAQGRPHTSLCGSDEAS